VLKRNLIVILVAALFLSGCAMAVAPVNGLLFSDVKASSIATSNSGAQKVGEGTCTSILGLIATGDCSIGTAAQGAKITKIHHVDYKSTGILGLFASHTVNVYGE
jgi:hypothetical protein